MTAAGIIPARYRSTRLPGKVLLPLDGYPMLYHVYHRASRCRTLRRVIVATDSAKVSAVCTSYGMKVVMTGAGHASGTDRVAEVAAYLKADLIVNIQADEPLLKPEVVDLLVRHMQDHPELPFGTVGSTYLTDEERQDPGVVKVVVRDGLAAAFYRRPPAEPVPGTVLRHIGLYVFRREFLLQFSAHPPGKLELKEKLEQLRAVEMGVPIAVISAGFHSVGVDTLQDYELVKDQWPVFTSSSYERVEAAG